MDHTPCASHSAHRLNVTRAPFITADFTGFVIRSGDFHRTQISCQRQHKAESFLKYYSSSASPRSSALYGTRSIITAFTTARHLSIYWVRSISSLYWCLSTSVVVFPQVFFHRNFHSILFRWHHVIMGVQGGADGWGIALQVGRLRVRFPIVSLEVFRPHYGRGVDSAPKRNGYQEYFLVVKAASAWSWQPHHFYVPIVLKSGSLNLLETSVPRKQQPDMYKICSKAGSLHIHKIHQGFQGKNHHSLSEGCLEAGIPSLL
jgi:hypothetical protein